jgi:aspartyl protease family protein
MATGSMTAEMSRIPRRHFTLLAVALCLVYGGAAAQDVGLAGVMGSKALLMIDGGEPQAVAIGQSLAGVKVISVQGDQAVVEIGGRKRPLRVGQHAIGAAPADGSGTIVMTADNQGHFYATGSVNGAAVRFLVDTGATMVSLGASDARRIGLDFNRGQKGMTQTANGQTMVSKVKLDTVRIGDVTLHNVDALIHQTEMPMALLGMSFLNRMEMQRDGSTMTLRKRF